MVRLESGLVACRCRCGNGVKEPITLQRDTPFRGNTRNAGERDAGALDEGPKTSEARSDIIEAINPTFRSKQRANHDNDERGRQRPPLFR
jgi:hypothetical protein